MLSELGCLTLTPDLLEAIHAGEPLTPEHEKHYSQHPQIAHDLLVLFPRRELMADMILKQKELLTSLYRSFPPDDESVRRGAQMLRVSLTFDHLLSTGTERQEALLTLSRDPAGYEIGRSPC